MERFSGRVHVDISVSPCDTVSGAQRVVYDLIHKDVKRVVGEHLGRYPTVDEVPMVELVREEIVGTNCYVWWVSTTPVDICEK